MTGRREGRPRKTPPVVDAGRYMGFGLQWALGTLLFLFLGWLVDRWLGTMPLFLILGTFIGAAAGFYSLYYHLVVEPRERERRDKDGTE